MSGGNNGAGTEALTLNKVLGPIHIWGLGVGIVLVGEFMGWNFTVEKGGLYGSLIACWFVGLLYTCVVMINSEDSIFLNMFSRRAP